jgi:hypothetical protein
VDEKPVRSDGRRVNYPIIYYHTMTAQSLHDGKPPLLPHSQIEDGLPRAQVPAQLRWTRYGDSHAVQQEMVAAGQISPYARIGQVKQVEVATPRSLGM